MPGVLHELIFDNPYCVRLCGVQSMVLDILLYIIFSFCKVNCCTSFHFYVVQILLLDQARLVIENMVLVFQLTLSEAYVPNSWTSNN